MSDVNIVVLIQQDKKGEIDRIAEDLTSEGLKIESKLDALGVISGSVDTRNIGFLREVEGVAHLREEDTFSLPPMDGDTPQ